MTATLRLVDTRIRNTLALINSARMREGKSEIRIDLDEPARGYLGVVTDHHYIFRSELAFKPLLEVVVTYRENVYYFDVRGMVFHSELYKTLKSPIRANKSDTFWLANELDAPLDAIENHMKQVLA